MKGGLLFLFILIYLINPVINPAIHSSFADRRAFADVRAGYLQERIIDRRDPFAIEIPAIESGLRKAVDGVDFQIPDGVEVTRFRVWLLEPYAQRIGYNFTAFLNGVSLGTHNRSGSDSYGKFLDIDLTRRPGLALKGDKNVIEVRAREKDTEIVYRASFVLLTGSSGIPPTKRDAVQVTCQEIPAPTDPNIPLFDPTIPRLDLTEPTLPIEGLAAGALSVRISGMAIDRPGDRLTLLVNGQVILSSPVESSQRSSVKSGRRDDQRQLDAPAAREIRLPFNQLVNLAPADQALIIEVRDRQQNRTTCTIPVTRPVVPGAVSDRGRKYAVLVGISDYGSTDRGLRSLKYADRDAEKFHKWLRSTAGGGFREEDIVLLTNHQATLAAVRAAINRFLTAATSEDLIYLFLAGHGGPDPYDPNNYYFLLHDSKIAELNETAYPMREIGEFLSQKKGKVRLISFFDTCHSAQITRNESPRPGARSGNTTASRRGIGQRNKPQADPPRPSPTPSNSTPFSFATAEIFRQQGWTVITSAGANEEAEESSRWGNGHGVFTWYLLQGLRDGRADLDQNCRVTTGELAKYVRTEVMKQTESRQRPHLLPGSTESMVLATRPGCSP